jgi:hypothetical protein
MWKKFRQARENLVRFQTKKLGALKHFLGLEVKRTKSGLFLNQQKYAKDLLQKSGMLICKPVSTLIEVHIKRGKRFEIYNYASPLVNTLITHKFRSLGS